MLIDLINSSNYIMINRDAIKVFGLNTAVYCSELLNIYKKAVTKKKITDDGYFTVDRNYITKQTSLTDEDQIKCDINLAKVNVVKVKADNPDVILFDVETFASILSCEDIKVLDNVSKKVKIDNPKGTKVAQRERIIVNLKESIRCKNYDLLLALRDWIDSVMSDPNKYLSVQQVALFKDKLDDYCNGNLDLALELVRIATIHQLIDCQWAINTLEKDKQVQASIAKASQTIKRTEQKVITKLGSEVF